LPLILRLKNALPHCAVPAYNGRMIFGKKRKREGDIEELRREIERLRDFVLEINEESGELIDGKELDEPMVERLKSRIDELQHLVFHDELTQILNRRGFYNYVEPMFGEALASQKRDQKRKFEMGDIAIIFVDGDNFKKINDTYGHDEGDQVLKSIAAALGKGARSIDVVARMGGEEFVMALVGANEEEAHAKANQILETIRTEVKVLKNPEHLVTASAGVAALSHSDADDLDELVAYADQAMYEAKINRGKNNVVKWSEISEKKD